MGPRGLPGGDTAQQKCLPTRRPAPSRWPSWRPSVRVPAPLFSVRVFKMMERRLVALDASPSRSIEVKAGSFQRVFKPRPALLSKTRAGPASFFGELSLHGGYGIDFYRCHFPQGIFGGYVQHIVYPFWRKGACLDIFRVHASGEEGIDIMEVGFMIFYPFYSRLRGKPQQCAFRRRPGAPLQPATTS